MCNESGYDELLVIVTKQNETATTHLYMIQNTVTTARPILEHLIVSPDVPLPLMSRRRVACLEELFLPIRLLNMRPRAWCCTRPRHPLSCRTLYSGRIGCILRRFSRVWEGTRKMPRGGSDNCVIGVVGERITRGVCMLQLGSL